MASSSQSGPCGMKKPSNKGNKKHLQGFNVEGLHFSRSVTLLRGVLFEFSRVTHWKKLRAGMLQADTVSSVVGLADNQLWKSGRVPLFHGLRDRFHPSKLLSFVANMGVFSAVGHITDVLSISRSAIAACTCSCLLLGEWEIKYIKYINRR